MPEDNRNNIIRGHYAAYQAVRCVIHEKATRYAVKYYPEENLFIVECIECKPANELVRVKVQK